MQESCCCQFCLNLPDNERLDSVQRSAKPNGDENKFELPQSSLANNSGDDNNISWYKKDVLAIKPIKNSNLAKNFSVKEDDVNKLFLESCEKFENKKVLDFLNFLNSPIPSSLQHDKSSQQLLVTGNSNTPKHVSETNGFFDQINFLLPEESNRIKPKFQVMTIKSEYVTIVTVASQLENPYSESHQELHTKDEIFNQGLSNASFYQHDDKLFKISIHINPMIQPASIELKPRKMRNVSLSGTPELTVPEDKISKSTKQDYTSKSTQTFVNSSTQFPESNIAVNGGDTSESGEKMSHLPNFFVKWASSFFNDLNHYKITSHQMN